MAYNENVEYAESVISEAMEGLNDGTGAVVTGAGAVTTDTLPTDPGHAKAEIDYETHDNGVSTSEGLND